MRLARRKRVGPAEVLAEAGDGQDAASDEIGRAGGDVRERRDGGDQGAGVGVLRVVEDGVGRALLDDDAALHDGDVVGDFCHHAEIMGDEQDGGAAAGLKVADEVRGSAPGW